MARILVDDAWAEIYGPYELREVIKSLPRRRWDRDAKAWIIPVGDVDLAGNVLRVAGCTVYVTAPDGTPWTSGETGAGHRSTPDPGWADALLDAVGPDRHDRVFTALTKILHPDAGGDTELMQQLNRARDAARFAARRRSA